MQLDTCIKFHLQKRIKKNGRQKTKKTRIGKIENKPLQSKEET